MHRTVSTIYMIDDSDDEAFMTRLYFDREQVEPALRHYFDYDDFVAHAVTVSDSDLLSSILVVDLHLRSSHGTDVIARLRNEPWGDLPIAGICSGSEDPADRDSALAAGADFFVTKPLNRTRIEKICAADRRLEASSDGDRPLIVSRFTGPAESAETTG